MISWSGLRLDRVSILIVLVGAALRLMQLGSTSLTNDELSAISRTQYPDIPTMLDKGVAEVDMHPAGVQLFLSGWTSVFGTGSWALRLPFVLCGLVSILLIIQIGTLWDGRTTGWIAASLFAALAFTILYDRLARPYAPGVMLILAATLYWSKAVLAQPERTANKDLFLFSLFGAMVAYTHYSAAIVIALLGLLGLLVLPQQRLLRYLASGALMLILFLPHWPITSRQLQAGGLGGDGGWLDPPGQGWLKEFLQYAFNTPMLLWILFGLALLGLIAGTRRKALDRLMLIAWSIPLLHFMFGYYYSVRVSPILQYSGLLFSFPFLLIGLARLIPRPLPLRMAAVVPLSLLTLVMLTSLSQADPLGRDRFGKFKELAAAWDQWANTYGVDEVTWAMNMNDPYYMEHYLLTAIDPAITITKERDRLIVLDEHLRSATTEYFAFAWSTIQMPPEVYPLILRYYPVIVDDRSYFNSRATLFSKARTGQVKDRALIRHSLDPNSRSWILGLVPHIDTVTFKLHVEFGPVLQFNVGELRKITNVLSPFLEHRSIIGSAGTQDVTTVFTLTRAGDQVAWHGSSLNEYLTANGPTAPLLGAFQVPEKALDTDTVHTYLWNPNKAEVIVGMEQVLIRAEP